MGLLGKGGGIVLVVLSWDTLGGRGGGGGDLDGDGIQPWSSCSSSACSRQVSKLESECGCFSSQDREAFQPDLHSTIS